MTTIIDIIKENRPKLSEPSLRSYSSIIHSLYRKLNKQMTGNTQDITSFFENNSKQVLEQLKDLPPNRRKTILAALVVLCIGKACVDDYRNVMLEDSESYNQEQRLQKKSKTQSENWISQNEVLEVHKNLERKVSKLWNKSLLSKVEYNLLQDYVILSLYVLIPPRRLLDYIAFKIRNINKESDNYMENRKFIFNKFKTAKTYKQQEVNIPMKLKTIISKWSDKNPDKEYLLMDDNKTFSQPKLTMTLNKIFGGRKISVNQLRHTFISDNVLKNMPSLSKLDSIAEDMGHSLKEQMLYKKL